MKGGGLSNGRGGDRRNGVAGGSAVAVTVVQAAVTVRVAAVVVYKE